MTDRTRVAAVVGLTLAIFVLVQLGSLALVEPFKAAGFQQVEDPSDPTNSVLYVGLIIVMTAGMLLAFEYGGDRVVRGVLVLVSAMISWYVFVVLIPPLVTVGGVNFLAVLAAGLVGLGLLVHPEWYVIDAAGIVMGAGAAGLFGISFGILPALLLLAILAVYDAISVYGTEHMLSLAEGVLDLHVPVVLIVPATASYSYLADSGDEEPPESATPNGGDPEAATEATGDGAESPDQEDGGAFDADGDGGPLGRGALFIGLGDAVIPTVLVASAAFFSTAPPLDLVPGLAFNLPALAAMVGSLLGLLALLHMVMKGRAHAGLPLLNGGAIGGYLVGALAAGVPLVEALGLSGFL